LLLFSAVLVKLCLKISIIGIVQTKCKYLDGRRLQVNLIGLGLLYPTQSVQMVRHDRDPSAKMRNSQNKQNESACQRARKEQ
jgi:hypothetical protein